MSRKAAKSFNTNRIRMFEELELDNQQPTQHTPSTKLEKQIHKLITEDAAQKGRTWQYYQNLKNEDREAYTSPKILKQMELDAQALGPAFFGDTDD